MTTPRCLFSGLTLFALLAMNRNARAGSAYGVYFGDLHAHTSYSDGQGTPQQAFEQAKSSGLADFMALTDHSAALSDQERTDTQNVADSLTDSAFVCIAAFEYTRGWGHMNTFATQWIERTAMTRSEYYDLLAADPDAIAQWNHPTYSSTNDFNDFSDYSSERDDPVCLMEIVNGGTRYESSYEKALDAGWHVAPAANSDTHSANWITGSHVRTVVLAANLTRAAIYDALRNRRAYATEDRNLLVEYQLNGNEMGSLLSYSHSYDAVVHVDDPDTGDPADRIVGIDLISNGGYVAAAKTLDVHTADWSVSVAPSLDRSYYFVRVTNAGGKRAYTAPIWVPAVDNRSITITSPAGGEIWYVGTERRISWTAVGVTEVEIAYSTDGPAGSTWSTVVASISESAPGWGYYAWTIPDTPSTDCVISVARVPSADVEDVSSTFEIRAVTDSDGDGMDDDWEIDTFGDLSQDATTDADGDGSTDYQEFHFGTDPLGGPSGDGSGSPPFSCAHGASGGDPLALLLLTGWVLHLAGRRGRGRFRTLPPDCSI